MKLKKDVTIYDIALKLALSSATVSRGLQNNPAINKNTRKRIQEAARELGIQAQIHLPVVCANKKQIPLAL
jgi:LacI family transcriptional regulator